MISQIQLIMSVFEYRSFMNAGHIFMFNVCFRHRDNLFYPRLCIQVNGDTHDTKLTLLNDFKGRYIQSIPRFLCDRYIETKKQYTIIDVNIYSDDGGHQCFILIDQIRKEIIYFDPMNSRGVLGCIGRSVSSFLSKGDEDTAIQALRDKIPGFSQINDATGEYEYKVKSLSYTMLECQVFIEGSRMVNDKRKGGDKSDSGYCVPMSFYILDAILSYRDACTEQLCLDHFIKHFFCNAQLIGIHSLIIDQETYIQFLSGHTDILLMEDTAEHEFVSGRIIKFISNMIGISIKTDFDSTCQRSPEPWKRFQEYCKHIIVDFRNERCANRPNKIYSDMIKPNEGFYGWIDDDEISQKCDNETNNLCDDLFNVIPGSRF